MGTFDFVRSEVDLPDNWTGRLQTKDFDCQMATVLIRADGRLLIERFEYEEVPKAERPYPDADDEDWRSMAGCFRRTNERWEDLNFHGDMNFYGGLHGEWREYVARFTEGQLVSIRKN